MDGANDDCQRINADDADVFDVTDATILMMRPDAVNSTQISVSIGRRFLLLYFSMTLQNSVHGHAVHNSMDRLGNGHFFGGKRKRKKRKIINWIDKWNRDFSSSSGNYASSKIINQRVVFLLVFSLSPRRRRIRFVKAHAILRVRARTSFDVQHVWSYLGTSRLLQLHSIERQFKCVFVYLDLLGAAAYTRSTTNMI